MIDFFQFVISRRQELLTQTLQHLGLTGAASIIAIMVGVPLGIFIRRFSQTRGLILGAAGVVQTIPSIALLALLMIPLGIGARPAIVALSLYALLPIIRNTYTGLQGVPPEILEAADGVGFTRRQRLWMIELPLALPIIVAGIRTAVVITVGIATLSALIGAEGLGVFIFRGISTTNKNLILIGVISASLMALALDYGIGTIEALLRRRSHSPTTS